jgi:hypothetical protein
MFQTRPLTSQIQANGQQYSPHGANMANQHSLRVVGQPVAEAGVTQTKVDELEGRGHSDLAYLVGADQV